MTRNYEASRDPFITRFYNFSSEIIVLSVKLYKIIIEPRLIYE